MKILMLGWELPPHNSGGLGVACYHMSKALALQGAEIDFIVPYEADHSEIDFMNVHGATSIAPNGHVGLGAYESAAVGEGPTGNTEGGIDIRSIQKKYVRFVEDFVSTNMPAVIHAHDWLTAEAGMRAKELTGAPLVVHVHATEFDRSASESGNPIVHEIEYQGLIMADRIIAVSQNTKNVIVEKYHIPADKIEVVYNALDVDTLNDGYEYDLRTYNYLTELQKEGYTIISTVTRFTVQKGLAHFLRAAAKAVSKYNRLAFLLAGDGEQRDELVRLAADLGIADKVFFTGFVRGRQWRDAYGVSDIFVMSSVNEPFGLTALEAAHHDNALILTNQSGVGEVLHNVFKYNFWDEDRLADQMVGIAASPALQSSLKDNVKREYTRISWHDVARDCLAIYGRQGALA